MAGWGGWLNPSGTTHYVRAGDNVISMGTGMGYNSICSPTGLSGTIYADTFARVQPPEPSPHEWTENIL